MQDDLFVAIRLTWHSQGDYTKKKFAGDVKSTADKLRSAADAYEKARSKGESLVLTNAKLVSDLDDVISILLSACDIVDGLLAEETK